MKAPNLHLNLLREQERVSSSPVRVRVMLPSLAILACVALLGWWGMLFGQQMLIKSQKNSVQADLDACKAQHDKVVADMVTARDYQAEIDQLTMYEKGRRTYGETFARLAEIVPEDIQILSLEIPEPAPQSLIPPGVKPGAKYVPLLGPTGTVERVSLRILGRTPKETPLLVLMDSLGKPAFSNTLQIVQAPAGEISPKIHSFRQDTTTGKGPRLLAFDIEYSCRERRFEK